MALVRALDSSGGLHVQKKWAALTAAQLRQHHRAARQRRLSTVLRSFEVHYETADGKKARESRARVWAFAGTTRGAAEGVRGAAVPLFEKRHLMKYHQEWIKKRYKGVREKPAPRWLTAGALNEAMYVANLQATLAALESEEFRCAPAAARQSSAVKPLEEHPDVGSERFWQCGRHKSQAACLREGEETGGIGGAPESSSGAQCEWRRVLRKGQFAQRRVGTAAGAAGAGVASPPDAAARGRGVVQV